jgi:8-oxo-dGTP pyrophosphatase MutT (NUDIX family)
MQFDEIVARLEPLPEPLPPPLDALMPIRTDGGTWRVPGTSGIPAGRPAAVLVLVYPDASGVARVVLIERPSHEGRHHSGEVSFPGGKAEPEDADSVATALREATEEVGLDPEAAEVRVIGMLDPLWIPVSDFAVTPIVALAPRRPRLEASPDEVVRILEPPMAMFVPGAPVATVERRIRDWTVRYGHYEVDGLSVWGATARILSQLGAVIADRAVAEEPSPG